MNPYTPQTWSKRAELFHDSESFSDLSRAQIGRLAAASTERTMARGAIVDAGKPRGPDIYVLVSGLIELKERDSSEGERESGERDSWLSVQLGPGAVWNSLGGSVATAISDVRYVRIKRTTSKHAHVEALAAAPSSEAGGEEAYEFSFDRDLAELLA